MSTSFDTPVILISAQSNTNGGSPILSQFRTAEEVLDVPWQQSESDLGLAASGIADPALRHDSSDIGKQSTVGSLALRALRGETIQRGARHQTSDIITQHINFQKLHEPFQRAFENIAGLAAKIPPRSSRRRRICGGRGRAPKPHRGRRRQSERREDVLRSCGGGGSATDIISRRSCWSVTLMPRPGKCPRGIGVLTIRVGSCREAGKRPPVDPGGPRGGPGGRPPGRGR